MRSDDSPLKRFFHHFDWVLFLDVMLLCSDGLTRTLSEEQILQWMQHEYISEAVRGLIADTLQAGAPDNVTAVIVEAYEPGWS